MSIGAASRMRVPRRALAQVLITLILAMGFALGRALPALAVDRAFTTRYTTNTNGDVIFVSNTLMNCSSGCVDANSGTMVYLDTDGTAASPLQGGGTITTFNSSSANLTLPAGATVLFAGLYWGGNSSGGAAYGGTGTPTPSGANAPTPSQRNRVYFRTPWMTGYQLVTATSIDEDFTTGAGGATVTNPVFHAFADVTSIVNQVPPTGTGTYSAANVQLGVGNSPLGMFGGWTLIVVTSDPGQPLRNLSVFDGWDKAEGTTDVDVKFGPFISPATGPITAKYGMVTYDGDPGLTGDAVTVGAGTTFANATCSDTNPRLSNTLNPNNNIMNSSITTMNANVSTRNPDQTPTWGYDADIVAGAGLSNGSAYGCFRFKTDGDTYWPAPRGDEDRCRPQRRAPEPRRHDRVHDRDDEPGQRPGDQRRPDRPDPLAADVHARHH
jgi:hypothetical protein